MFYLINNAYAESAATSTAQGPNPMIQFLLLGGFVVVFWLLVWRPQSKRAKAHKELMANLSKGDEVVTTGGVVGKITRVADDFVSLQVNNNVVLDFQKGSITATLPKGTLKEIKKADLKTDAKIEKEDKVDIANH